MKRANPRVAEWIVKPALDATRDLPVKLGADTELGSLRVLETGRRLVAVLNNWGADAILNLHVPRGAVVTDLITGTQGTPTALKAGGAAVLLFELSQRPPRSGWQAAR